MYSLLNCTLDVFQYFLKTQRCKFGVKCKFNHPKDILLSSVGASIMVDANPVSGCALFVLLLYNLSIITWLGCRMLRRALALMSYQRGHLSPLVRYAISLCWWKKYLLVFADVYLILFAVSYCHECSSMWRLENVNLVLPANFTTRKISNYHQLQKIMVVMGMLSQLSVMREQLERWGPWSHSLPRHYCRTPKDFLSDW